MPQVLVARPVPLWRQVPVAVLLITAQVVVGLVVLALRTARAFLTLAVTAGDSVEHRIAARTGRPALSRTGIAAICAAFVDEFRAAYHQPTR